MLLEAMREYTYRCSFCRFWITHFFLSLSLFEQQPWNKDGAGVAIKYDEWRTEMKTEEEKMQRRKFLSYIEWITNLYNTLYLYRRNELHSVYIINYNN
jgi:hypothetical protein